MFISSLVQKYQTDSALKQATRSRNPPDESKALLFGATIVLDGVLAAAILAIGLASLFCGWLPPAASYSMIGVGGFYLASFITMYALITKNKKAGQAYIKWAAT